ncbi:hypothetical protein PV325_001060 [Microctonus aethiopoides]|nr:hypothetical protein PV325_001060 [Microctonus aethiopoides]
MNNRRGFDEPPIVAESIGGGLRFPVVGCLPDSPKDTDSNISLPYRRTSNGGMSSRSAAVPGAFTLSMFSAALEIPGGYSLEVDRVGEYSIVFTAAFIVRLYWRELKVIPSERRGTCFDSDWYFRMICSQALQIAITSDDGVILGFSFGHAALAVFW